MKGNWANCCSPAIELNGNWDFASVSATFKFVETAQQPTVALAHTQQTSSLDACKEHSSGNSNRRQWLKIECAPGLIDSLAYSVARVLCNVGLWVNEALTIARHTEGSERAPKAPALQSGVTRATQDISIVLVAAVGDDHLNIPPINSYKRRRSETLANLADSPLTKRKQPEEHRRHKEQLLLQQL